jgi:hypothetical protein
MFPPMAKLRPAALSYRDMLYSSGKNLPARFGVKGYLGWLVKK